MHPSITAVTVCVGYADILETCVRWNRQHFSRWIVVTTSEDEDTQALCRDNDIECLLYDGFTDEHGPFQKSKGINEAFKRINFETKDRMEFVLHIDADIVLPRNFTRLIQGGDLSCLLSAHTMHSAHRVHLPEKSSDEDILKMFGLLRKHKLRGVDGDLEAGFFQLFRAKDIGGMGWLGLKHVYPEMSRDAGFDDILFVRMFPQKRTLAINVIHLGESEVHWKGRVVKKEKGDT
jgi:hypothetical protein